MDSNTLHPTNTPQPPPPPPPHPPNPLPPSPNPKKKTKRRKKEKYNPFSPPPSVMEVFSVTLQVLAPSFYPCLDH